MTYQQTKRGFAWTIWLWPWIISVWLCCTTSPDVAWCRRSRRWTAWWSHCVFGGLLARCGSAVLFIIDDDNPILCPCQARGANDFTHVNHNIIADRVFSKRKQVVHQLAQCQLVVMQCVSTKWSQLVAKTSIEVCTWQQSTRRHVVFSRTNYRECCWRQGSYKQNETYIWKKTSFTTERPMCIHAQW